ncbi:TPA: fimbrial protein [Klebsiella aerogenes]|nr:fimbrial protein [Klebsiella aerogenes]
MRILTAVSLILLSLLVVRPGLACTPEIVKGHAGDLVIDVGRIMPVATPGGDNRSFTHTYFWDAVSHSGDLTLRCRDGEGGDGAFDLKARMNGGEYDTTVRRVSPDGTGVRVSVQAIQGYDGLSASPVAAPFLQRVSQAGEDGLFHTRRLRIRVEVFSMSPVIHPGRLDYRVDRFLLAGETPLAGLRIRGYVVAGGCHVTPATPSSVRLPAARLEAFTQPGATDGNTAFDLALACDSPAPVRVRFDGEAADGLEKQGVLKNLAGEHAARGIGVQLLYHDMPVPLHQALSVGVAPAGGYRVPLRARYYRTGKHPSAGHVYAAATYTLSYY